MATPVNTDLGGIPQFDCHGDPTTVGARWKKWKRAFDFFVVGKGITNIAQKKALLLHCGGMGMQDIYYTFPETEPEEEEDEFTVAVRLLDQYFSPQINVPYERHLFRNTNQMPSETIDQYVTRLRQRAEYCEFGTNVDEQIRDQVIEKCLSHALRRKLLEKGRALTLEQLQNTARAMEASEKQAGNIEGFQRAEMNQVRFRPQNTRDQRKTGKEGMKCFRCDQAGHHQKDPNCPARNKECFKCNKKGHFSKCCKTKNVQATTKSAKTYQGKKPNIHLVDANDSTDDEYAFTISDGKLPKICLEIGGVPNVEMIVDSGACCNVIDRKLWEKLKKEKINCVSTKCTKQLYSYGSSQPLKVAGCFVAKVSFKDASFDAEFTVIEEKGQALLGRDTAIKLNVLKINDGVEINSVESSAMSGQNIISEYGDCFQGLGKLKDFQLDIPIDKTVKPVAQQVRRVPFSLRSQIEKKLDELEKLDVIEKAQGPTPWISPVVIIPKSNDEIRLCVDMRQANSAIVRERHPKPTVEEVLHEFNGSSVFSKLDIKWAFHQVELSEDSRPITTFVTHKGLYRYKRLMFGVSCAPEMYQRIIQQVLQGCEGAINIFDDIIVHGATVSEHNQRLHQLLQRIRERGLTLNKDKCKFNMSQVEFMGHLLSARGIGPSKVKVEAVLQARQPESASEVRSFLGLVTYSARFIPDLSTISEPLRKLIKQGEKFNWGPEQERSFRELKHRLAKAETLGYFDTNAKTKLVTDASPVGLGAVLTQEKNGVDRVICYASRSLSEVEKRYSQTEKEALGIVWACERFHMYLYGIEFELLTDHKPLEFIYSKKSRPSARISRWVLRLQPYRYTVKHIPGKSNIADSLSRLQCYQESNSRSFTDAEKYVRFVAVNATPIAMTPKEIEQASAIDEELSNLRKSIRLNRWHELKNKQFLLVKEELCLIGKLVLRGTRIIVPQELRDRVLQIAHEGHPGIVSMKKRLRSKVWWPGIDKEVERFCQTCHSCQLVGRPQPPEPMKSTELPQGPWQHVSADLMTPSLPSGHTLLVVVDYYSRYFEVEFLKSTTTDKVIASLNKMFLIHGLPKEITTDNGPQFISKEFEDYLEMQGIKHRKVTPLWPQANGEVERQNRSLLKRLKISQIEKRDWKDELSAYLTMYRTTPHSTTGVSPAELLFRRKIRTRLPEIDYYDYDDLEMRDRDKESKQKSKIYTDEKRRAQETVTEGDKVLLRRERENKLTPTFHSQPYEVKSKVGNSVLVQSPEGVQYQRNVTHVKKYQEREQSVINQKEPVAEDQEEQTVCLPVEVQGNNEKEQSEIIDIPRERPVRTRRAPARFKDFDVTWK